MEVVVDERKIWWLASYPKSGNTWVRMFVNAYVSGFPLDINSGFQYTIGDNHLGLFQTVSCRPVNNLTSTEQVYIRPAVLVAAISMSASKHVCLKTHHSKVKVDDMPLIPPKLSAGGVYIVRDPRDVAISFADHLGENIDTTIKNMNTVQYVNEHVVTKLMHVITTWSMHVDTWIYKNTDVPVKVIKYEDMLINPEREFKRVLQALGFNDIDRDRFKFALKQSSFKNLQKLENNGGFREKGQGDKFFRVGRSGQWREVLTEEQISQIEADHGEVMEKLGYELSGVKV
jgi:hypothetical protein